MMYTKSIDKYVVQDNLQHLTPLLFTVGVSCVIGRIPMAIFRT